MRRRLLAAGACAAAAAVVWAVAFHTAVGARADAAVLGWFLELSVPGAHRLATAVARLADPAPVAVFTAAIAGIALARRRVRPALTASAILLGANVSTQVLKVWTAEPRPAELPAGAHVAAQSWPSGHATAAAALALCLVVVVPSRLRPPAAVLGGGFALGVACSVLVLGWHLPSDAIGGFLVAATWTLAGLALARLPRRRMKAKPNPQPPDGRGTGDSMGGMTRPGRIAAGVRRSAERPREPDS